MVLVNEDRKNMKMDNQMERISEVTEPDNLDVLSEKNMEVKQPERKSILKKTPLPQLQENIRYRERSMQPQRWFGAKKKNTVRKTRSTPDVLFGTSLEKLSVDGTSPSPKRTPKGEGKTAAKKLVILEPFSENHDENKKPNRRGDTTSEAGSNDKASAEAMRPKTAKVVKHRKENKHAAQNNAGRPTENGAPRKIENIAAHTKVLSKSLDDVREEDEAHDDKDEHEKEEHVNLRRQKSDISGNARYRKLKETLSDRGQSQLIPGWVFPYICFYSYFVLSVLF